MSEGSDRYNCGIAGKFCKSIGHPWALLNLPSQVAHCTVRKKARSGGAVVTAAESERKDQLSRQEKTADSSGMTSSGRRTSQGQYLSSRLFF